MEQSLNIKRKRTRRASVATAMASACAAVIAATVMAGASPGVAQEATREPGTAVPQSGGLAIVNYYRDLGNVAPVSENTGYSRDALAHARYTVETGTIGHTQDPNSPYYTPGGERAAKASNVTGSTIHDYPESYLIGRFVVAPFHGLAMLDPRLSQVGYGVYRDPASTSGLQSGIALDVTRGKSSSGWSESEPVVWPADGQVSPFLAIESEERPDPLATCGAGYAGGAGAPVYVMTPEEEGPYAVEMRDSSGRVLETCSYDARTYRNADRSAEETARFHLMQRNAIVIVPREVLSDKATYTVGVTTCSREMEWSFGTAYAPETYTPVAPVAVTVGEPAACSNPPVDPDGPGTDEPPTPPKTNAKPIVSGAKVKVSRAPRSKAATKRPRPVSVTAVVRDGDQNLQRSNIVVKLDGKTVRKGVKYASGSDRLSVKTKVRKGRHAVTIQARDARGVLSSKTVRFKVK